MSFTYGKVESQVSSLIGAILGEDMATAGTNYSAVASTANRKNVDFSIPAVQDAIVNAITDIALAIAETPRHPERANMQGTTVSLANRSVIPSLDSLGSPFVGIKGRVYDFATAKSLVWNDIDAIRSFNEHTNIYSGFTPYWYAYNGNTIEHTRTSVAIEGCVWVRPTFVSANNITLDDIHEMAVVMGAIRHLCPREALYLELWDAADKILTDHFARIRALGAAEAITLANAAPPAISDGT